MQDAIEIKYKKVGLIVILFIFDGYVDSVILNSFNKFHQLKLHEYIWQKIK